jgi:hypothetical protein
MMVVDDIDALARTNDVRDRLALKISLAILGRQLGDFRGAPCYFR